MEKKLNGTLRIIKVCCEIIIDIIYRYNGMIPFLILK